MIKVSYFSIMVAFKISSFHYFFSPEILVYLTSHILMEMCPLDMTSPATLKDYISLYLNTYILLKKKWVFGICLA